MKWKELNKSDSIKRLKEIYNDDCSAKDSKVLDKFGEGTEYLQLRAILKQAYSDLLKKCVYRRDYKLDLEFGLVLYSALNSGMYKMSIRDAANNGIWRFLSVELVPDIIMDRWKGEKSKLPADHFYEKPNRNYLKSLWWYIHLSWQGSSDSTREILKKNSTDTIVNLVERAGRYGYQVNLYRKIMLRFTNPGNGLTPNDADLFRKVMKLHTTRYANIEPSLYEGGEAGYVKELYSYFK